MTRQKKLLFNTTSSFIYQIITLLCGFILPRFILAAYGSEVNGLLSSITHFLGFIVLAECGVGAVVQSALYKPLADKNDEEVSKIIISSDRFFHKIALFLLIYTVIMMAVYPLVTIESFDYFYTATLILIISFTSFVQYYFSMSYTLLLSADAMGFINMILRSITLILNTVFSIILLKAGASVHAVKLVSSVVFLIQPIFLTIYVKRHYNINKKIVLKEEPIKQKWNGLLQHIAYVVLENTDIVVLTLFSTLQNVSIYSVYHLVVNGVKQILISMTNGIQALFGEMYAKEEKENLDKTFSWVEWVLHTGVTFFFLCTAVLIVPFVSVYTKDIHDANYIVPLFAAIITLAQASYCLRLPYNMMVLAAGHYRQTQWSALIEVIINISVSVFSVKQFGLVGVGAGTFIAMMYRTIYYACYLSRNIIYRPLRYFIKHIIVDVITAVVAVFATCWIDTSCLSYGDWIIKAVIVALIVMVTVILMNVIFYRTYVVQLLQKIKKIIIKR